MSLAFRRTLVVVAVLFSGWAAVGCAESPQATAGATGTSGATVDFVEVKATGSSIIIQNKAGQPLLNVAMTLRNPRGSSVYTNRISRLESSGRMEIPFSEFKTGGGLPFRSTPKAIEISAVDFVGAKREGTIPLS